MSKSVSANLAIDLANLNFSFDELILVLKEEFDRDGLPAIAAFICQIVDKILVKDYERVIEKNKESKCCMHYAWNKNGTRYKNIMTSIGKVKLKLSRMSVNHHPSTSFSKLFNLSY